MKITLNVLRFTVLFLSTFLLLFLHSCGLNTKSHYFNLEDFTDGKVYYFECEEDSSYDLYLEMFSDVDQHKLTTTSYNASLIRTAEFVEEYNEEGTVLTSFTLFANYDGVETEQSFKVIENEVIQWEVTDEPFSYVVESLDGMVLTNTRNYITRAHMDIMGEKYEVLGFKDVISYSTSSITFTENKYYGEGIGLVGIEIFEGDNVYHLRLVKMLSKEEWFDLMAN